MGPSRRTRHRFCSNVGASFDHKRLAKPVGQPLTHHSQVTSLVDGRRPASRHHSGLMLAIRITLPHFSVSSAINLRKSAGEPASGGPPRSASRALILASANEVLISLLSRSTISTGVALGAA